MKITMVGNFTVPYSSENHHKKSLEDLGHTVIALQEGKAKSQDILDTAMDTDMLVWIHTHGWVTPGEIPVHQVFRFLEINGIPTLTYHLDLWFGLERQNDLQEDPFYKSIKHFFTVDKKMAEYFNEHTNVKGHYLQAGVFKPECVKPANIYVEPARDVVFVGSKGYHPEWQYRPRLINWLRSTYGRRFTHVGGDGDTGTVRGMKLNALYHRSKVAVGDSLCLGFDYPYYWSDRVYETIGRGGFIIHPYIKGMEEHFEDKKHLVFYEFNNFEQLEYLINYYLQNDEEREQIRKQGHEHVKANHTYNNRWEQIIKEVSND